MALQNVVLLCQVSGYVTGLILSVCITVPMALHQDEFRGHCLLFSTGSWQESNGQFLVDWASQAYCNYAIFVGVLLGLVSIIQIYRMSVYIHRGTDANFLMAFFDVLLCVWLCVSTIIAACFITFGFSTWCTYMTKRFPSCAQAAGQDIDKADGISTSNFYLELGTAQFGAWASMATWVGLSVFALLKLCYQHQISNMRVSMLRERQRLINQGQLSADPSSSKY